MSAAVLFCLVVGIADGDTLRARCDDLPVKSIRLAEVDAPEKAQPFGQASKQHLAGLCFQKRAVVEPKGRDRFGRMVARVRCEGTDVSAEQAMSGLAWAFTPYLTDPAIGRLEAEARAARRGLWTDPNPVAPWVWRRERR